MTTTPSTKLIVSLPDALNAELDACSESKSSVVRAAIAKFFGRDPHTYQKIPAGLLSEVENIRVAISNINRIAKGSASAEAADTKRAVAIASAATARAEAAEAKVMALQEKVEDHANQIRNAKLAKPDLPWAMAKDPLEAYYGFVAYRVNAINRKNCIVLSDAELMAEIQNQERSIAKTLLDHKIHQLTY